MKNGRLNKSIFVASVCLMTSQAQANPQQLTRGLRTAGVFAVSSFLTHETANLRSKAPHANFEQHIAFALSTSGFAGLGGMYLGSGVPAFRPIGALFMGMSAWGQYLSYKKHHPEVDKF